MVLPPPAALQIIGLPHTVIAALTVLLTIIHIITHHPEVPAPIIPVTAEALHIVPAAGAVVAVAEAVAAAMEAAARVAEVAAEDVNIVYIRCNRI
ncbi:MAG: hypothetical protein K2H76_08770 [Muribaculaceae bacterium]|nr:hypothetical protein [Muribaculaceae bacterium]